MQVQVDDPLIGHEVTFDKSVGFATNFSGTTVGVTVGAIGVGVGGMGVAVGGLGVAVGAMCLAVGAIGVAVADIGIAADMVVAVAVTFDVAVAVGVNVGVMVGLTIMVSVGDIVPDGTDDATVFVEYVVCQIHSKELVIKTSTKNIAATAYTPLPGFFLMNELGSPLLSLNVFLGRIGCVE